MGMEGTEELAGALSPGAVHEEGEGSAGVGVRLAVLDVSYLGLGQDRIGSASATASEDAESAGVKCSAEGAGAFGYDAGDLQGKNEHLYLL